MCVMRALARPNHSGFFGMYVPVPRQSWTTPEVLGKDRTRRNPPPGWARGSGVRASTGALPGRTGGPV
ncbi:hypothetical protein GA0115252_150914 [Streptomyces sp. DfronAA-171]|nr:hypothetical protein GA0115252_150914 [Streptomyces sp. DfronAA-171]